MGTEWKRPGAHLYTFQEKSVLINSSYLIGLLRIWAHDVIYNPNIIKHSNHITEGWTILNLLNLI